MSNQYGPRIVTENMLLYLDVGNNKSYSGTGTTWGDLSGNNYNFQLANSPTYSSNNKGVLLFDGVNDYAILNHNNAFNIGTQNFTIDIWMTINALLSSDATFRTIFQKGRVGNSTFEYGIQIGKLASNNIDNHLILTLTPPGSGNINTIYNSGYNNWILNRWYHIVVVKNSTTASFYINGTLFSTINVISSLNTSTDPIMIAANSAFTNLINGRISNLKCYIGKALNVSEVRQNYNATKGRFNL